MIEDISYKDYNKKNDIHGIALYPAPMVAPVQKDIIREISNSCSISSIFDAFHGSGTSLFEGNDVINNVKLYGCDINPLANLITKVKLQGIDRHCIKEDIKLLIENIENYTPINIHTFRNIDKWFRYDIIQDLSKLRSCIMLIQNYRNRLYFWCVLSDIIRKYSNSRSSTYKLHIKEQQKIDSLKNNVINDFIISINNNIDKFSSQSAHFELYKCDVLAKFNEFKNNIFDLSITSPPYGDNNTTVPYGQFSILPLLWIDNNDLELEGWELDTFSGIDSNSLGGRKKNIYLNEYELNLITPYLSKISIEKQKKVIIFFSDYFIFLRELCRVTNKYIVMTLGNRTVDGININLTEITTRYLERNNFENIQVLKREIPYKRTPKKTSKVKNKPVSSMNDEYVIIHKKTKYLS